MMVRSKTVMRPELNWLSGMFPNIYYRAIVILIGAIIAGPLYWIGADLSLAGAAGIAWAASIWILISAPNDYLYISSSSSKKDSLETRRWRAIGIIPGFCGAFAIRFTQLPVEQGLALIVLIVGVMITALVGGIIDGIELAQNHIKPEQTYDY